MHFSIPLFVLAATPLATALGINCRGSGTCPIAAGDLGSIATLIDGIDDNRVYNNGEQIACTNADGASTPAPGGLCAFLQNSPSQNGGQIRSLIAGLQAHGCSKCGSIPTQPGNDVSTGELTVNYVSSPCGYKLC